MSSLLSKYHDKLQEKLEGRYGEFLYRGQENTDWKLRSGAVRRILSGGDTVELQELIKEYEGDFHKDNLHYHERELVDNARLRGLHRETDGRELKDLELLARLQHHGAATCLLDFTSRFDVALWFACQKKRSEDKDGMVFVVDLNSVGTLDLGRIGSGNLNYRINRILRLGPVEKAEDHPELIQDTGPKFWYWHPEAFMSRMLIQESRFLFGLEDIPVRKYIISVLIEQADKDKLLVELKRYCGLSRESLFPDIHGFAAIHSHENLIQGRSVGDRWQTDVAKTQGEIHQKSIEDYRREAIEKIQMGEYSDAIKNFDKIIELNEKDTDALLYHGVAMLRIGIEKQDIVQMSQQIDPSEQYNEYFRKAIKNFDEVIKLDQDHADAHYFRSITFTALGRYGDARSGFKRAHDLYSQRGDQRGVELANLYLRRLDELQ